MKTVCSGCGQEISDSSKLGQSHLKEIDGIRGERKTCPETGQFAHVERKPTDREVEALQEILIEQAKDKHQISDDKFAKMVAQSQIEKTVKKQFTKLRQSERWDDPEFWEKVRDEAGLCDIDAKPGGDWEDVEPTWNDDTSGTNLAQEKSLEEAAAHDPSEEEMEDFWS